MLNKIILALVLTITLISWPISLIQNPPNFQTNTIFYSDNLDTLSHNQKTILFNSPLKRIFYNRLTIYQNRYINNFLYLIDINNYFFMSHPRELPNFEYRFKFPFISFAAIIFALPSIIKKGWAKQILLYSLPGLILIPLLKNIDGYDIYFIPIFILLFRFGYQSISSKKYGSLINIIILLISIIELFRIL